MKRLLSLVLSLSLLLTMSTGFADKNEAPSASKDVIENIALPDIIEEDEAIENKYVGRLTAMEQDLSTFIFANEDGTQTLRMFSHPVKFVDEEGKTKDITLDIAPAENGAFKTKDNSIITSFEKKLSDGISLEYDDIDLLLKPKLTSALSVASSNGKTVTYPYGQNTKIEYSLTYTGFKEDIVVEQYTGQTEYEFTLYTNGLKVEKIGETYKVIDNEGNIKANIGDIIIFTADERNNTFGELTCETVKENEEYLLTIHIDADYLSDPKTTYPIRIDPTIEINYSNSAETAIQDVTINSTGGSDGSSGSLRVGKRETYGISRILMKFPALSAYTNVPPKQVVKASVEIRDIICESDALEISCYQFTGNAWNESTANWSNVNPNSIGTLLSSNTVSYANGVTLTNRHRYSFDITSAVLSWKTNTMLFSKGIVFKATASVENGSTYISKTFSSYERSSNQPSLSVVYTNPFYSTFEETKNFYINSRVEIAGTSKYRIQDDNLQLRANCYGYALRLFSNDSLYCYATGENGLIYMNDFRAYAQLPGEFALAQSNYFDVFDEIGVNKYKELEDRINEILEWSLTGQQKTQIFYELMCADMECMGYNVTYAGTTMPISATGINRRLCLVIANQNSFHFYMQHSDGTWSHKPGPYEATDECLCDLKVKLTDETIDEHACEDYYEGAGKIYFYVNKPTSIDCNHFPRNIEEQLESTEIHEISKNAAGSTVGTAKKIENGVVTGNIEYAGDIDYYWMKADITGTSIIHISSQNSISITIYDSSGTNLGTLASPTAANRILSGNCVKDEVYYFKITAYSSSEKYDSEDVYRLSVIAN